MSDTDIYKKREPMPYGSRNPKRSSRRRRSHRPNRVFDYPHRKRRSRNSGLRRMLHLYRKKDNEKVFWWSLFVVVLVVLILLAIWQFVILEARIQQEEQKDDYIEYQQNVLAEPQSTVAE